MSGLAGTAFDNVQHLEDLFKVVHLLLGTREVLDRDGHGVGDVDTCWADLTLSQARLILSSIRV